MDQGCIVKEPFGFLDPYFTALKVQRCLLNEEGAYRGRKASLMVKAVGHCCGELDSISAFVTECLCDAGHIT